MFCEYLGLSDKGASTTGAYFIGRNDIATGDFICYKTQSEEISCCVHLKPENQERIWIPYTICKNTYGANPLVLITSFSLASIFVCKFLSICKYVYESLHVRAVRESLGHIVVPEIPFARLCSVQPGHDLHYI